jgi:predicted PurR-regulated permease PerM
VLLGVLAVAAGLWVLYQTAYVLLILLLSTLFAYVIAPLVRLLCRPVTIAGRPCTLPRGIAIALVYALIAAGVWACGVLVLPSVSEQVADVATSAPGYTQSIVTWERGLTRYYQRLRMPAELRNTIDRAAVASVDAITASARGAVLSLVSALTYAPMLVLIPILAFLLLKDAPALLPRVLEILPPSRRERGLRLVEDLNATLAAYIRAQLVACALVGTVCGVGFALLGVPYALLLGVLAGVLEFIPLVGPFVLAVVATAVAVLHGPGFALALWVLLGLAVFRIVHDYMIYPRLVGHTLDLHPFGVVVAVLAGAELGGVAGLFLAVPVAAMLSVIVRHWLLWSHDHAEALPHVRGARPFEEGSPRSDE